MSNTNGNSWIAELGMLCESTGEHPVRCAAELDARNVRWEWRNEFTGDVHGGEDRYERLIDLCSGGFEATAWFRTTVMPVIAAMAAEGGGTVTA